MRQFFVGEPLPLPEDGAELTLPSGETSKTAAAGEPFRPVAPGIYRAGGGREFRR